MPARPPSEPPQGNRRGDGTVYYLFSPPACRPTLRVHATSRNTACRLDHKSGHAHRGRRAGSAHRLALC
jgi:hypothetical protein